MSTEANFTGDLDIGYTDSRFPDRLYVQAIFSDPLQANYIRQCGAVVLTPIYKDGLQRNFREGYSVAWIDETSPYRAALDEIIALEDRGKLTPGSSDAAQDALLNGIFEQSQWEKYLPRQDNG